MKRHGVLIVEDSHTVSRIIEEILIRHGYSVLGIAETADEAVALADTTRPDLVLMDIWLKGERSGLDAAREITGTHRIPVIYLTSNSDVSYVKEAQVSEGSSYLVKPVNPAELVYNIEMALHKSAADKEIRLQKMWREAILESIIDGVIAEDGDGNIFFMNTPAKNLLGIRDEQKELKLKDCAWFYDMEGNALEEVDSVDRRLECQMKTLTGRSYYVILKIQAIVSDVGEVIGKAVTITNITEERVMMDRIRFLTFHDNLTGLYNRNYLEEEMQRINLGRQYPLSIIMADLNGLKIINDILGHIAGDDVLRACARLLKDSCRGDDIISRFGGDEFLVFLPQTEAAQAEIVAERIRSGAKSIETPFGPLSVAVGLYSKVSFDETVEDSVRRADEDMYRNKALLKKTFYGECFRYVYGRMRVHPHEGMHVTTTVGALLEELASRCGSPEFLPADAEMLSELYDIGMVYMPEELWAKARLNENDWECIRRHPEISYKLVNLNPDAAHIGEAILYHHERWDGNGYPFRLSGEKIPMGARMLAVTDAYCAMLRKKPHHREEDRWAALQEIQRNANTQFDPWVVERFMEMMR